MMGSGVRMRWAPRKAAWALGAAGGRVGRGGWPRPLGRQPGAGRRQRGAVDGREGKRCRLSRPRRGWRGPGLRAPVGARRVLGWARARPLAAGMTDRALLAEGKRRQSSARAEDESSVPRHCAGHAACRPQTPRQAARTGPPAPPAPSSASAAFPAPWFSLRDARIALRARVQASPGACGVYAACAPATCSQREARHLPCPWARDLCCSLCLH